MVIEYDGVNLFGWKVGGLWLFRVVDEDMPNQDWFNHPHLGLQVQFILSNQGVEYEAVHVCSY